MKICEKQERNKKKTDLLITYEKFELEFSKILHPLRIIVLVRPEGVTLQTIFRKLPRHFEINW